MKWTPGDRSNIDDARGRSGFGMPGGAVPIGLGGLVLLAILSWATGTNFLALLNPNSDTSTTATDRGPVNSSPAEERDVDFVDAVMRDVQATWTSVLGPRYQPTRVVLFRDAIGSACGMAQSATGPFYCPQDQRVYLDLGFFQELSSRFGAPGDFARAYVVAHEVGHHVQRLMGIERQVRTAQQTDRPRQIRCRCVWSFKPTASRACGGTQLRSRVVRLKAKWNSTKTTSTTGSAPRRRLETIGCSACRPAV